MAADPQEIRKLGCQMPTNQLQSRGLLYESAKEFYMEDFSAYLYF